jgi:membrane-bound serine protease (ClpP class)
MTGESGLIGETGVVITPLTPTGRIQVHGELWFARCRTSLTAGQRARVTAVDGLTLEVEPEASATGSKGITP